MDSVDQYLNIQLGNVEVVNKERYPHLVTIEFDIFICRYLLRIVLFVGL